MGYPSNTNRLLAQRMTGKLAAASVGKSSFMGYFKNLILVIFEGRDISSNMYER
jgi:hypothetical protein